MFKLKIFCYLFVFISIVLSDEEIEEEENKIESLCERPIINAADRMVNNTVRLYRGRYYWILNGLTGESATLDGPYEIPFQKMGSIFKNNTVVTLLGGTDRGKTVKTEGKSYWLWDDKGNMKTESSGLSHNRFPTGGFEAAIHDGNMDDPTLIGFKGIKSYYFSTRYRVWTIDNKPSGYFGGKYNESFPTDLSAAFTIQADNPKDGYIAYFFKRDKYCKRPKILKSGKECDEWLPNKALFGCDQPINERIIPGSGDSDTQPIEDQPPLDNPRNISPQPVGPTNPNIMNQPSTQPPAAPSNNDQQESQSDKGSGTIKPIEDKPAEGLPSSTSSQLDLTTSGTSLASDVSLVITFVLFIILLIYSV